MYEVSIVGINLPLCVNECVMFGIIIAIVGCSYSVAIDG